MDVTKLLYFTGRGGAQRLSGAKNFPIDCYTSRQAGRSRIPELAQTH